MLVVAQFAVSIGLITCTAIVYAQTVYARTADPGYQRDGLLQIDATVNYAADQSLGAAEAERLLPVATTWLGKSEQARLDFESLLELAAAALTAHRVLGRRRHLHLRARPALFG